MVFCLWTLITLPLQFCRVNRLQIVREMHSGVTGKTKPGGQSARRYERLRDMQLNEYFTRVGVHANEAFLALDNLKGIIIGWSWTD